MASTSQFASSIQTIQYFDILAPAPQNTFKGTLVGGVFATRKCRRVSIELHRLPLHHGGAIAAADATSKDDGEQSHAQVCYIRILKRTKSTLKKSFSTRNKRLDSALLEEKEETETEYHPTSENGLSSGGSGHFLHSSYSDGDGDNSDSNSQSSHSVATAIQCPKRRMEEQMVNASFVHMDPIDRQGQPLPPSPHSLVTSPTTTATITTIGNNNNNNNNPRHSLQSHHLTTLDEGREISTETMSSLSTTATTIPTTTATTTAVATSTNTTPPPTWKTQYKIPLAEFHVMNTQKDTCTVSFQCGHGKSKRQTRVFVFATEEEAQAFGICIQSQIMLFQKQKEENFLKLLSGLQNQELILNNVEAFKKQPLEFLVEIVGAQNLARSDLIGSSDPYVKVFWGDQMIHKTKYISDK